MDTQKFLTDIQGSNVDARFAAWRAAGEVAPAVIPQLGKLVASNDPGVSKAAREALTAMTHAVGKDTGSANRAAVVKGLLEVNSTAYSLPARVHAIRLLSNIAGEDSVPAIARDLANADLREEAIYCLERIPGDAAIQAMITAYKDAPAEFKPRILAALGHRRATSAAGLCTEAMRSANADLAIAGSRALARIGAITAGAAFPQEANLSAWHKVERMDAMLLYAGNLAKSGNTADAMAIYKQALERPEEHVQCAAIIGIAKFGTADAAAIIMPKMKSTIRNVRITAQKAWKGMAPA